MIDRKPTLAVMAGVLLLATSATWARLPPPNAAEAQVKKAAAEKKAKDEEAAKKALAKAQERVAARYRSTRKHK